MPGVPPNAIDMLKRLGRSIFSRKKKDRRQAESSHHAETHASSGSPASHSVPAAAAPIAAAASVGAGAASVAPAVDQPTAAIAAPAHSAEQPAVEERNNDTHHRPQADAQPIHAELPADEIPPTPEQKPDPKVQNAEHVESVLQPVEPVTQSAPVASEPEHASKVHAPIMLNAAPEQAPQQAPEQAVSDEAPATTAPVTESASSPIAASTAVPIAEPVAAPAPVSQQ